MSIHELRLTDFRNLTSVSIHPQPSGLNLIVGANGSGKTSLLESIYYLSTGRSFRTSTQARLIRDGADKFSLYSQLVNPSACLISAGHERTLAGQTRVRLGEKEAGSLAALTAMLPTLVLNAHSHQLLEAGPIFRRKYLDWGLFYDTPTFLSTWRHYERALKQRNAVLRDRRVKPECAVWTDELVKQGLLLDQARRGYLERLIPILRPLINELLPLPDWEVDYYPGWDGEAGFAAALAAVHYDEIRAGHTLQGPHRADFDLTLGGVSVKHILSRGQQKCLICAMILAQGQLLAEQQNRGPVYLVDDLPAELDERNKATLLSLLFRQPSQIFITAIEKEAMGGWMTSKQADPMKVFHVEHGCVGETSA